MKYYGLPNVFLLLLMASCSGDGPSTDADIDSFHDAESESDAEVDGSFADADGDADVERDADVEGDADGDDVVDGDVEGDAPLLPPTGLSALGGDGAVYLSWAPDPVEAYRVFRSEMSGGAYSELTSEGIVETTFVDRDAANGRSWFYVVTALSGGAESDYSLEVMAHPPHGGPFAPQPEGDERKLTGPVFRFLQLIERGEDSERAARVCGVSLTADGLVILGAWATDDDAASLVSTLEALGGERVRTAWEYATFDWPVDRLSELIALPEVTRVGLPLRPILNEIPEGAGLTEGSGAIGARDLLAQGYTGEGWAVPVRRTPTSHHTRRGSARHGPWFRVAISDASLGHGNVSLRLAQETSTSRSSGRTASGSHLGRASTSAQRRSNSAACSPVKTCLQVRWHEPGTLETHPLMTRSPLSISTLTLKYRSAPDCAPGSTNASGRLARTKMGSRSFVADPGVSGTDACSSGGPAESLGASSSTGSRAWSRARPRVVSEPQPAPQISKRSHDIGASDICMSSSYIGLGGKRRGPTVQ